MAHVTGLGAGLVLGVALGFLRRRIRLRGRKQAILGWGTLVLLVAAWALALNAR